MSFFVFFVLTSFLTFNLLTLRLSFNSGKNHFFLFLWDKVWLRTPLRNGIRICFMKRKSYRPSSWNNKVRLWSWPYGPMVKILLFSLGSMSSNLAPCLFFIRFGPIIQEKLIMSKEGTLLEAREFLNSDLNLTSCVLNNQNG